MEVKLYENDYEKPDLTDEFLEHHGIKGQKWGVRNGPPYPLSSGKSKKVRESYGGISKRKKKKQQLKNLEKARRQRAKNIQERKETAQTKEEILKNRDPVAMLKNVDKFTTKEIQDFNTREQAISQLSQQAAKQIEKNMPKSQKLVRWVKDTVTEGARQAAQQAIKNIGTMAVKKLIEKLNNETLKKAANLPTNEEKKQQKKQEVKNKGSIQDKKSTDVENSKKALRENQDMLNDLLYNVKYSTSNNKKEANKEYNDALKEVAKRYDVNYRYLDEQSKAAFQKREDEILKMQEKRKKK